MDDEFNAFFDEGDRGIYEGGRASVHPAPSLEPSVVEEPEPVLNSAQLARRARYTRVVATVVFGCAALILVALSAKVRFIGAGAGSGEGSVEHSQSPVSRDVIVLPPPGVRLNETEVVPKQVAPPPPPAVDPEPEHVAEQTSEASPPVVVPESKPLVQPTSEALLAPNVDDSQSRQQKARVTSRPPASRGIAPRRVTAKRVAKPARASAKKQSAHSQAVPTTPTIARPSVAAFPVDD